MSESLIFHQISLALKSIVFPINTSLRGFASPLTIIAEKGILCINEIGARQPPLKERVAKGL